MTRKQLISSVLDATKTIYDEREAWAIAYLLAEKLWGFSRAEFALQPLAEVEVSREHFAQILMDLAAARPVQYVIGEADFDGLQLAVGEGVLIPRPETEELVRWVAEDAKNAAAAPQKILDIGTGSGAIAIALARRLAEAEISAIDISSEALKWANINNLRLQAGVRIRQADALDPALDLGDTYNIIVSNPPYIPASERAQIADNVRVHEPGGALFVPDSDPLLFYRAIAKFARRTLEKSGALYFEIHENFATEVSQMLHTEGFKEVEVRHDINSKPRMLRCS